MKTLKGIGLEIRTSLNGRFKEAYFKFNELMNSLCLFALAFGILAFSAIPCVAQSNYTFITIAGSPTNGAADGIGPDALFNSPESLAAGLNYNIYVADTRNNTIREIVTVQTNWLVSTIAGFAGTIYTADDFSTNGVGPQNPQNDDYFSSSNNYTAGQITNVYANWFGGALSNVLFSSSNINTNPANGSMQVNLNWTPGSQFAVHHADYSDNPNVSSLTYTSVEMDVRWDPSSTTGTGNVGYATFGPLRLGVRPHTIYNVQDWFYTTNIPASITNWVHINAPLSAADTNQVNWGELLIGADSSTIGSVLNGPATFYVDDIRFLGPLGTNSNAGSTDGLGRNARFNGPAGITADSAGNVYVADTDNSTIRKLTPIGPNWVVSTIAGLAGVSGANDNSTNALLGRLNHPWGIGIDASNNLYVADSSNQTIRMISPVGVGFGMTTIAGRVGIIGTNDGNGKNAFFYYPKGMAVNSTGDIFVADASNNIIRKVTGSGTNWTVSTIAGRGLFAGHADGTNANASFFTPAGIAVDKFNNLYVADTGNGIVRKIAQSGTNNYVVTTIGGIAGVTGYQDGTFTNAQFTDLEDLCVDPLGNLRLDGNNVSAGVITLDVQGPGSPPTAEIEVVVGPQTALDDGGAWTLENSGYPFGPKNGATYILPATTFPAYLVFSNIIGWNVPVSQSITVASTFCLITDLPYTVVPPVLSVGQTTGLGITGTANTSYEIDYTTDLKSGSWQTWMPSLQLGNGFNQIASWPPPWPANNNASSTYYRAVWLGY